MAAKTFGNWQVIAPLGEGGQGSTYIVRRIEGDDKQHVLKRLKNVKRLERFRTEIQTINSLNHPNIIKIVDFNLGVREPYYVTPLYGGGDLTQHLAFWKDDVVLALKIFLRICDGVRAAHLAGVVHRDLKPENILFTADGAHPVVADFGIAFVEEGERQTLTLEAVGPRFYIAPELEDSRADDISPRSDLYSLGKVLYWMLSGGGRFARERQNEREHRIGNFVSSAETSHISPILDKTIAANISDRYLTIDELINSVSNAIYSIQGHFNPTDLNSRKVCLNCGQSDYVLVVNNDPARVNNFGLRSVAGSDWRIYACPLCSHIAMFRPDYSSR